MSCSAPDLTVVSPEMETAKEHSKQRLELEVLQGELNQLLMHQWSRVGPRIRSKRISSKSLTAGCGSSTPTQMLTEEGIHGGMAKDESKTENMVVSPDKRTGESHAVTTDDNEILYVDLEHWSVIGSIPLRDTVEYAEVAIGEAAELSRRVSRLRNELEQLRSQRKKSTTLRLNEKTHCGRQTERCTSLECVEKSEKGVSHFLTGLHLPKSVIEAVACSEQLSALSPAEFAKITEDELVLHHGFKVGHARKMLRAVSKLPCNSIGQETSSTPLEVAIPGVVLNFGAELTASTDADLAETCDSIVTDSVLERISDCTISSKPNQIRKRDNLGQTQVGATIGNSDKVQLVEDCVLDRISDCRAGHRRARYRTPDPILRVPSVNKQNPLFDVKFEALAEYGEA